MKLRMFVVLLMVTVCSLTNGQTRVYVANDDHSDYLWNASEDGYKNAFLNMLAYYIMQADTSRNSPSDFQGRFSADGWYWFWTWERCKTSAEIDTLVARINSGHITIPMQFLPMVYGAMSTETVIRSMYYAGKIERRYNIPITLVSAMENQTHPLGINSLWSGSGAKYSWKGICQCYTDVPVSSNRGRELYYAGGLDGRSVLTKWNTFSGNNQSLGGYAECRSGGPTYAVDYMNGSTFLGLWPYDTVKAAFGWGWDDVQTTTDVFIKDARTKTTASQKVRVSNEVDFFQDIESSGISLPTYVASFGNDWDRAHASVGELSATVKRSVELLRTAEMMATLVCFVNPTFMDSYSQSADSMSMSIGKFYEHCIEDPDGNNGSWTSVRLTYTRNAATQVANHVAHVKSDASAALSGTITCPASVTRFYVTNPLGWTRTDFADIPNSTSGDLKVIDVTTGQEVRCQKITIGGTQYLRILAENVPSVGYKVYEIQSGRSVYADSTACASTNTTIENDKYKVVVGTSGEITSLIDKRNGNYEWKGAGALNNLGVGSGTPTLVANGPVCAVISVVASGSPNHTTTITMYKTVDRVDIQNEITSSFGDTEKSYSFEFNISGQTTYHEELGAILTAKKVSQGGHYSENTESSFDYLTMNRFVDMSDATKGITLSNWDSQFFRLGSSSGRTLDITTPRVRAICGARPLGYYGFANQGGDTYFKNRYSLRAHGAYDATVSLKMSLEHQTPFACGYLIENDGPFPHDKFSLMSVNNGVLLTVKPVEDGFSDLINGGCIVRVWNANSTTQNVTINTNLNIVSAYRTTHLETDISGVSFGSNSITESLPGQWIQTYRIVMSGPVPIQLNSYSGSYADSVVIWWSTATETNNYGFEISRSSDQLNYTVVDFVYGSGTSLIPHEYYFTERGTPGTWYYQVTQIDLDGKRTVCFVIKIVVPSEEEKTEATLTNYPNPFELATMIKYGLPTSGTVSMTVYDILGQEVEKLIDNKQHIGGEYSIYYSNENLATGVYICELTFNGKQIVKKLMILK